jgi:hypothetical protein
MWEATDTLDAERRIARARKERTEIEHENNLREVVYDCVKLSRRKQIEVGSNRLRSKQIYNICKHALSAWVQGKNLQMEQRNQMWHLSKRLRRLMLRQKLVSAQRMNEAARLPHRITLIPQLHKGLVAAPLCSAAVTSSGAREG